MKIVIDNQYVTSIAAKVCISPQITKRKHRKNHIFVTFLPQFANRDKNYIRNKVLPRLAEKLGKEHPDVPNHPRQRYRTINPST